MCGASCGTWDLCCNTRELSLQRVGLFVVVCGLFIVAHGLVSLVVRRGLSSCGARAQELVGLVAPWHVGS